MKKNSESQEVAHLIPSFACENSSFSGENGSIKMIIDFG
jgi:hypothetical protein